MKFKDYWNLLLKKTDAERPAKLTWKNVKAVFQAKRRQIAGFELDNHIYEQIIWRRTQVQFNSPHCWYSGKCKVCGCDILEKTMEDRACSISEHPDILQRRSPCYPEMMNNEDWQEYKKLKKIKLFD